MEDQEARKILIPTIKNKMWHEHNTLSNLNVIQFNSPAAIHFNSC